MAEDHGAPEAGLSPGPGPEVVERDRESQKSEWRKESVAGQCRMRRECPRALQEGFSILPILGR